MKSPTPKTDKIINSHMTEAFGLVPRGAFKAFVRFAAPEKTPSYMKVMELHSPGLFKVSIPCDQMETAADDENVLSIELREHTT